MASQTLYSLIDSIQVSRIRLNRFQLPEQPTTIWTPQEEKLLLNVCFVLLSSSSSTEPTSAWYKTSSPRAPENK